MEIIREALRESYRDVPPSDELISLIGLAIARWAQLEPELARIAHGLADGNQQWWNCYCLAETMIERIDLLDEQAKAKLEYTYASCLSWTFRRLRMIDKDFRKLLRGCWIRPSDRIVLCPSPTPRPPIWQPHFPIGHWGISNEALSKISDRIGELHMQLTKFCTQFSEPNECRGFALTVRKAFKTAKASA